MVVEAESVTPAPSHSRGSPDAPWRVGTLGLDDRMRNALAFFFLRKLDGRFALVEPDLADVLIIDLDSYGSRDLWVKQTKTEPAQPTILLSVNPVEVNGSSYFISKPMKPRELISALMDATPEVSTEPAAAASEMPSGSAAPDTQEQSPEAVGEMEAPAPKQSSEPGSSSTVSADGVDEASPLPSVGQAGLCLEKSHARTFFGSAPDIDPDDRQAVAGVQFDPENHLIGKLHHAVGLASQQKRAVRIELDGESITVFPHTDKAAVNMHYTRFRGLAVILLSETNVRYSFVDHADLKDIPSEQICRLEALLWTAALLASRGRVPAGTDLKAKISLKRWPNLTRLDAIPHAIRLDSSVRITSLLSREPISLVDAAKALKLPQRYLFAYFTAASALDLMNDERPLGEPMSDQSTPAEPAPKPSRNRGLFKRILSHLRD